MSNTQEYEDLDALLKAPGWLRVVHAIKEEWVGKFDQYVTAAVNGNKDAMTELMKLTAARTAVLAALQYPEQRLRQLDAAAATREAEVRIPLSRRGTL
jgi:hypothetical protein